MYWMPEGVTAENANRESRVQAVNDLPSPRFGAAEPGDIIRAVGQVKHNSVAQDKTKAEEPLRGDAVVVVALAYLGDIAGRGIADAAEGRPLERYRSREPPLKGSPERDGGAGNAEDVRRDVVIAAVEAPYSAIGVARLVVLSEEEAADHEVFDRVIGGADAGQFEMEVVERPRIAVAGLPGKPIGHGVVRGQLVPVDGARAALVVQGRIQTGAEPQAPEDGRIMARKHGFEAVTEGQAIETRGWRNRRGAQFAPEPGFAAIALEHQAGHPEQHFAEEGPGNAAGDLVIGGGRGVLPVGFPEKAARVGIEERFPVIEAGRSRESIVHGSLIRMVELVHGEGVLVDPPGPVDDVVPEG